MTGAMVRGADLMLATMKEVRVHGADFSDSIMLGADLQMGSLSRAKFMRATLTEANFASAAVEGADFYGAEITAADFSNIVGKPLNLDLTMSNPLLGFYG